MVSLIMFVFVPYKVSEIKWPILGKSCHVLFVHAIWSNRCLLCCIIYEWAEDYMERI